MKKTLTALAMCLAAGLSGQAQDPAGNCINISFEQFEQDALVRYINGGNDASLNLGSEATIEIWTRAWDTGWNQKLVGKNNDSFNSGYVLAIDQGKIYPEVWSPVNNTFLEGFMPPIQLWYHLAITFEDDGNLVGYINGVEEGSQATLGTAIAENMNDLILFIAPWDEANFQAFGEYDEVRIWNRALTGDEIRENMHKPLTGNENGLVAYYDFNETAGPTVADKSPNGNDGTFQGAMDDENLMSSRAVIGDDAAVQQQDVHALWNGVTVADPRFIATDNGISLTASNIPEQDYVVFGHDNGSGTSSSNIAAGAPANFDRTGRIWYLNVVGEVVSDVAVNLSNAAGGGAELDGGQPASHYTLLWRPDNSADFISLGSANLFTNGVALFEDVELFNGYYAIGVGDAEYVGTAELGNADVELEVFPNPSSEAFNLRVSGLTNGNVEIINALGQTVYQQQVQNTANGRATTLNPNLDLPAGTYIVRLTGESVILNKKLIRE